MGTHHQTFSKISPQKIDKHHPETVRPGGSVRSSCFSPDGEKILAAVRRDFSFFSPWEKDGHIWKPWESGILKLGFDLLTLIVFFHWLIRHLGHLRGIQTIPSPWFLFVSSVETWRYFSHIFSIFVRTTAISLGTSMNIEF